MKRTEIAPPTDLPRALVPYLAGARVYNSSCSREATVYYIEGKERFYLKRSPADTLRTEWEMTSYFYAIGLSVEPLLYLSEGGEDFLLTRAGVGEDGIDPRHLAEPRRLAEELGRALRLLHEIQPKDCPVPDRTARYLATVEEGYAIGRFDGSYAMREGITPDEAIALVRAAAPRLTSRVLLHGDYCLPNVLFDGFIPTAFIDLGAAGVGDRHIDLFWGAWTLNFNLGTDEFREVFYRAYGRDLVDDDLIAAIGAAECFA